MNSQIYREYQFDGLVGPSHNYGGLSHGNTASTKHGGLVSNPREAFIQGLEKMKFISGLKVGQAFLPPQDRPQLKTLRSLGYRGTDEEILAKVSTDNDHLLRLVSSASSMWTANAATVVSSDESEDKKVHFVPANLSQMFHRNIECEITSRILKSIFSDKLRFDVHDALPSGIHFSDEGAANHMRLKTSAGFCHLFAWGRSAFQSTVPSPQKYPARQTFEASEALCRLHRLSASHYLLPQQTLEGIDAGAFHTDVLAVGNDDFLMLHELAFVNQADLCRRLKNKLGAELCIVQATRSELPVENAVKSYPFNSQVLTLEDRTMVIVAPMDAKEDDYSRRFLERVVDEDNRVVAVHYLDLRQSMQNGGGPACLRLRVRLTESEVSKISAKVFYSEESHSKLLTWCQKYYRDRLTRDDLSDFRFHRESMAALDELTQILQLGSIYDFQQS